MQLWIKTTCGPDSVLVSIETFTRPFICQVVAYFHGDGVPKDQVGHSSPIHLEVLLSSLSFSFKLTHRFIFGCNECVPSKKFKFPLRFDFMAIQNLQQHLLGELGWNDPHVY